MRTLLLMWIILSTSTPGVEAQRPRRGFFAGRVIASGQPRPDAFVQLEGLQMEHLRTVMTDADGGFRFDDLDFDTPYIYIVVEEAGFQTYRERLDVVYVLGGNITIYLEPEDTEPSAPGQGPLVVDVRQLQVRIPDDAWEAYDRGVEEARRGNHESAAKHLERALDLAPDFYEARVKLGDRYAELGRHQDAETAYLAAMESNPAGALAALNLGALYYQEAERALLDHDPAEAEASLEKAHESLVRALELDPFSPGARFFLGATLYRSGAYLEAERMLVSSLEIDGRGGQARLMLINVYTRQGRLDAALDEIATFLEENPDSPQRPAIEQVRSQIEAVLDR